MSRTAFDRAWAMFPALDEPMRTEWAERVSHNILLQYIYANPGFRSESEYLRDKVPYEPADMVEDPR